LKLYSFFVIQIFLNFRRGSPDPQREHCYYAKVGPVGGQTGGNQRNFKDVICAWQGELRRFTISLKEELDDFENCLISDLIGFYVSIEQGQIVIAFLSFFLTYICRQRK